VDLDVGRERTVTLKVPALRRAEMIEDRVFLLPGGMG
jgi:hypothetical protein